jgi:hypothetical protein
MDFNFDRAFLLAREILNSGRSIAARLAACVCVQTNLSLVEKMPVDGNR